MLRRLLYLVPVVGIVSVAALARGHHAKPVHAVRPTIRGLSVSPGGEAAYIALQQSIRRATSHGPCIRGGSLSVPAGTPLMLGRICVRRGASFEIDLPRAFWLGASYDPARVVRVTMRRQPMQLGGQVGAYGPAVVQVHARHAGAAYVVIAFERGDPTAALFAAVSVR